MQQDQEGFEKSGHTIWACVTLLCKREEGGGLQLTFVLRIYIGRLWACLGIEMTEAEEVDTDQRQQFQETFTCKEP